MRFRCRARVVVGLSQFVDELLRFRRGNVALQLSGQAVSYGVVPVNDGAFDPANLCMLAAGIKKFEAEGALLLLRQK